MKPILTFMPKSDKTKWIFKSKIGEKTRLSVCLRKLDKLYENLSNEVAAGYFQTEIMKTTSFFKKESDRMSGLIFKKTKSKIKFNGGCKEQYEIVINSQLSFSFYVLLQLFDDLMCLVKSCNDLGIFQERSLMYRKIEHYKKCIKRIVHNVCQYNILNNKQMEITS